MAQFSTHYDDLYDHGIFMSDVPSVAQCSWTRIRQFQYFYDGVDYDGTCQSVSTTHEYDYDIAASVNTEYVFQTHTSTGESSVPVAQRVTSYSGYTLRGGYVPPELFNGRAQSFTLEAWPGPVHAGGPSARGVLAGGTRVGTQNIYARPAPDPMVRPPYPTSISGLIAGWTQVGSASISAYGIYNMGYAGLTVTTNLPRSVCAYNGGYQLMVLPSILLSPYHPSFDHYHYDPAFNYNKTSNTHYYMNFRYADWRIEEADIAKWRPTGNLDGSLDTSFTQFTTRH